MKTLRATPLFADVAPENEGSDVGLALILLLAVVVAALALVLVLRRRH